MPPCPTHTIALQGFSEFERATLASFFRLAAQRSPATYVQVPSALQSDFVIADAGQPAALAAVLAAGRSAETVFVGGSVAPAAAAAWLPRPIAPMQIVRHLDALVARRVVPPGPDLWSGLHPDAVDLLLPDESSGRDVLVVDDNDGGAGPGLLALQLQRFGYRVHSSSRADEAIEKISRLPFRIVFVDMLPGPPSGIGGLQVCRHAKQRPDRDGGTAPAVVMVAGGGSSRHRVLGTLAGCDAYLTRPLRNGDLVEALRRVDPEFNAKAATSKAVKAKAKAPVRA